MGDSTLRGFGARGGRRWTFWFGVGLVFEVFVVPTPYIRAPYIRGGWYSASCLLRGEVGIDGFAGLLVGEVGEVEDWGFGAHVDEVEVAVEGHAVSLLEGQTGLFFGHEVSTLRKIQEK